MPTLAVLRSEHELPLLDVVEAAAGLVNLVWVADDDSPADHRLLEHTGTVVDATPDSNPDALAAILRERHCDGLITFTDRWYPLAAAVASRLGLPHAGPAVVEGLVDKAVQRRRLRDAGVAVPAFVELPPRPSVPQRAEVARTVGFPAVVKPRRGAGSRNTVGVADAGELRAFFDVAEEPGGWVVEEFLAPRPGAENRAWDDLLSVESVVQGGRVDHVVATGRFPFVPPFRDTGGFLPAFLPPSDRTAVEVLTTDAIRALGIESGCCHTELKLTPAGPRIIEVNGRVGGHVPDLLAAVGGPPIVRWAMQLAIGKTVDVPSWSPSVVSFFLCEQPPVDATRLVDLQGVPEVLALPGVRRISVPIDPGSRLDWRSGVDGYVFSVEGVVADHAALWPLRERVLATVRPTYRTVADHGTV